MKNFNFINQLGEIHRQTEELLKAHCPDVCGKIPFREMENLLRNIRTDRIESEVQNEKLRGIQMQLETSRNRYYDLYEFAPAGYFIFDADGIIMSVNLTGALLLGVERWELTKVNFAAFISPECRCLFDSEHKRAVETRTERHFEIRLIRKDGKPFYVHLKSIAVEDDEGILNRIRTAVINIDEQIKAKEALQHRLMMEELIAKISSAWTKMNINVSSEAFGEEIKSALAMIGRFVRSDRCYIALFSKDGTAQAEQIYEWCETARSPQPATCNLQPVTGRRAAEKLRRGEIVYIPDTDALTREPRKEKKLWQAQGIRSFLAIPIFLEKSLIGYFGLDARSPGKIGYDEDIRLVRVIGEMFAHLLARVRTQESLRKSEQYYRAIVEDQTEMICRFLPDATILFVNKAYCRYFGKNEEELIGRRFLEFVPEDEHEGIRRHIASFTPDHYIKTYEHYVTAPEGETRWQQWVDRAIFDARGELTEFQSVGRDITEQKKAEAAWRRYEFIANSSKDFMTLINRDYVYEAVNLSYRSAFDKDSSELVGKTAAEVWGAETFENHIKPNIDRCLAGNEIHFEGWFEFHNKGMRYYSVSYYPYFNEKEKVTHAVVFTLDLTERKQAEDALEQAYSELKSTQSQLVQSAKLASVGQLVAGVVHELNQPLTVIRGTAQLILRLPAFNKTDNKTSRKTAWKPDELIQRIERIEDSTSRMMNIINHLRSFSRQSRMNFQPVNINKVIEESFLMVGEQLRVHNIEVRKNMDLNLPEIRGDANQIEQVFLNLFINARDAIEEKRAAEEGKAAYLSPKNKGILEVTSAVSENGAGGIEILVSDTGGGISAENTDKIFDPFFTTKDINKGMGLGLSISYGIIKDHNGDIEVAQTGQNGTTFKIKFPTG